MMSFILGAVVFALGALFGGVLVIAGSRMEEL